MYPTPELISYIQSQLSSGVTREAIIGALRSAGWSSSAIVEAFAQGSGVVAPTATVSSTQEPINTRNVESASFPQSSVRSLYTQPGTFTAGPIIDTYRPRSIAQADQSQTFSGAPADNVSPTMVNTASATSSPVVKKKSKAFLVFSIFLFIIIIAGALFFLYSKQKGIDIGEYINTRFSFLSGKKTNSDTATAALTDTEKTIYDAFNRLALQKKLETQTIAKVSLPRSSSQSGGFINEPSPVGASSDASQVPGTDTTGTTATATAAGNVTPTPTVTPTVNPQDIIDVRVVSQRDTSGTEPRHHTMVLAQSTESTEVDAELRIVGGVAHLLLKELSLLDALGIVGILDTWIDIQSAQTDLPLLKSIGLPGDIVKIYIERIARALPGTPTVVQQLMSADVFRIVEPPRSSLVDTTHVHEYDFTVDTARLPKELLSWLDPENTLPADAADGLRNFVGALTEVKGVITTNAETNDIMIVAIDVTGLIEKGVPFTVSSTLNFMTAPTIIPIDVMQPATPLRSVIDTFLNQMGGASTPDNAPAPNPAQATGANGAAL